MLFNSYAFLFVFLPLALAGYYLAAHVSGPPLAKLWLCAASFVFYSWWNPLFVLLLAGSIAFNYSLSRYLVGDENGGSSRQGTVLFFGVSANILLLFYYKYLFPILGFLHHLGWLKLDAGSVVLPIGISFFTFTQIGYLVDCRQGLVRSRALTDYVLFVTFFPHLIAGPILHHREIMPQFARDDTYRLRARNLAVGLTLFTIGLAKKILLADSVAPSAEVGFANAQHLSALQSWSAALDYSMQLYFDFSGYSDMAIGLGIMFAIRLPLNFNSPYQSLSIIDFWQRWHITLTRYLTLLIYNPLAVWVARARQRAALPTNRRAAATVRGFLTLIAFPTFATVLIAGIWHGAGLPFILYGVLHGIYLTANHAWRLFRRPFVIPEAWSWRAGYSIVWRWLLTYGAVLLAEISFRSRSLSDALRLLSGMLGLHPSAASQPLSPYHLALILALMLVAFACPNVYQFLGEASPALTAVAPLKMPQLAWRPHWRIAIGIGFLLAMTALFSQRTVQFLYFQF
jgi:D-alanyl-lipoteichoic acid acyltransferase DltB (MBOAT superfamily)